MTGAVDFSECSYKVGRCRCGKCVVCGFHKHMAVHGPLIHCLPGSKPWDHEFVLGVGVKDGRLSILEKLPEQNP